MLSWSIVIGPPVYDEYATVLIMSFKAHISDPTTITAKEVIAPRVRFITDPCPSLISVRHSTPS